MAYSPQDVYTRHLISRRGYPLWTPEPNMNLPDGYVREGLKIGDVGVVVPEDGSFDVFFNLCLPPTHSLHRETGVPNNFAPILLSGRDIAKFPDAECAGRIISTPSVARVRDADTSDDEDLERRTQLGPLNYEFTLSSREGAVLILPEGAERYYLRNERLFLDEAIQHALDWYTFAVQRLGRIISHDSLYLITGFYKTRSWSLAAYQHGAGTREASAQFKAVQVGRGNISGSYTWEATRAMDWRVGPSDQYYYGMANQTVFIQGFKIAVREGILGKRVNVKVDVPSVRTYRTNLSSGSRFSNLWSGRSKSSGGSTTNTQVSKGAGSSFSTATIPVDESSNTHEDITIQRFPHVAKLFHPSDIINQHLLRVVPSASVAVTHDSQWTMLLERGLLNPGELSQADHLVDVIGNYAITSRQDAVYLDSKGTTIENDYNVITTSIPSEGHPTHASKILDIPTTQRSDLEAQATSDPPGGPIEVKKHVKLANMSQKRLVENPPSYQASQQISTHNVLIVGETGAGKSSVVNLIAGERLAVIDSAVGGCTLEATSYDVVLDDNNGHGHHIRLFDTVGLNNPSLSKNDYLVAIEKANTLTAQLLRTGGIRLLIFCIRGGRITSVTQNNYHLFRDILCQNQVPVAFVITGLENETSMEDWWKRNVSLFEEYDLSCASHTCVTAVRGLNDCYANKYHESQMAIRAMLLAHVTEGGTSWHPERIRWFIHLAGRLLRWLGEVRSRRRQALTVEELSRYLQEKCKFSRSEAEYLATKVWAKRLENAGPDFVKSDGSSVSWL